MLNLISYLKKIKVMKMLVYSLTFSLKSLIVLFFATYTYLIIGFPISQETFFKLLPSIITILSVLLVFFNVNRTQKKNFENDLLKFRRDAQIKVADELIDILIDMEDISKKLNFFTGVNMSEKEFNEGDLKKVIVEFYEKSKYLRSVIYRRENIIKYNSDFQKYNQSQFLKTNFMSTLNRIETKLLVILFESKNRKETLKEVYSDLNNSVRELKENVSDSLYGDIFKPKGYLDISYYERLKHLYTESSLRPLFLILLLFLMSLGIYFIKLILPLFIL